MGMKPVLAKPHFLSFYIYCRALMFSIYVLAKPHFLSFYISFALKC